MAKNIGIWLDLEKANIIEDDSIKVIDSNVDHFNVVGGSRANTPYGAQDATSESKHLEKKKHQLKDYFDRITAQIGEADKFVVFGPAEAKTEFKKHLESQAEFSQKLAGVETADSMTDNQLKEWVRTYFA